VARPLCDLDYPSSTIVYPDLSGKDNNPDCRRACPYVILNVSWRCRLIGAITGTAALFALAELTSFLFSRIILVPKGVMYVAPDPDPASFIRFLAERDPILGWTARNLHADLDGRGSRKNSYFSQTDSTCMSVYGDSFTYSMEVEAEYAWPNLLSGLLQCRVDNFGVGGYGTDQALLRYLNNSDKAPVVLLVHQVENILRNANQYRQLLYAGTGSVFGFKPIFHLEGSELMLEPPLWPRTIQDFRRIVAHPSHYLRFEYFTPNGPSGKRHLQFPYLYNLLLSFGEFHIRARMTGAPWYAEFYRPDHPSSGLHITTAIAEAFASQSAANGQKGIFVILPPASELAHKQSGGPWTYAPLLNALNDAGIQYIDLGPVMLERTSGNACDLTTTCSAHYNQAGYKLVAETLFELTSSTVAGSMALRFDHRNETRR
jgi:hypothetical protein